MTRIEVGRGRNNVTAGASLAGHDAQPGEHFQRCQSTGFRTVGRWHESRIHTIDVDADAEPGAIQGTGCRRYRHLTVARMRVDQRPFDGRPLSASSAAWTLATRIDNLDAHDGYQPVKGRAGVALAAALLALAQQAPTPPGGRTALAALTTGGGEARTYSQRARTAAPPGAVVE